MRLQKSAVVGLLRQIDSCKPFTESRIGMLRSLAQSGVGSQYGGGGFDECFGVHEWTKFSGMQSQHGSLDGS